MSNTKHWWQGAVIYQIYPRSFADSNGDGIGDLKGITQHLDHVASLGVDGIWISPFFTSPMYDFGYDVADCCDVDPVFGTLADFDEMLAKAHSLGLRVIIDQVYSHLSFEHPWFKESQKDRTNDKADWFIWADAKPDGSPPNNWQAVFAGPSWTWDSHRQQYYMHNFLPEQPDLNLHTPAVQDALLDVARFWLDRGVDGFRLDATNHYMHDPDLRDNPVLNKPDAKRPFDMQDQIHNQSHPAIPAFLERLRGVLDSYGDRFTVAEVGGNRALEEMAEYTEGEKRLSTAYSFIFLEQEELSACTIRTALNNWNDATSSWPSWTFSNHDRERVVSRWADGRNESDFAKQMNMLLVSLRGTLFLYQGEELGLPHADVPFDRLVDPEAIANWPDTLGRDGTRTPVPWADKSETGGWPADTWLPIDNRHFDLSVETQENDQTSTLAFTRSLIKSRKGIPALVTGDQTFIETSDDLLAFTRTLGDGTVLCVFNLGHEPAKWQGLEGFDTADVIASTVDVASAAAGEIPVCGGFIAKL